MARPAVIADLASLFTIDDLLHTTYTSVAPRFGAACDPELAAELQGASIAGAVRALASRTPMSPDEWPELEEALLTAFGQLVAARHLQPQPFVDRFLPQIQRAGIPLAIVSTLARDEVALCLEYTAMTTEVRAVHCVDRGVDAEPSRRLHDTVIVGLAVDPELTIAIEHTAVGVRSAAAADLFVVTDPTVQTTPAAHGHIDSYNNPDLLEQLLTDARSRHGR